MYQPSKPDPAKDAKSARVPPTKKSAGTKSKIAGQKQPQIKQLSQYHSVPNWLKSLLVMQEISMILFCSIFGLSSIVYGYTMHTQTAWRTQQEQLKRWQNQERQQAVMNENLKQQMAESAEQPGSGLVEPKPERLIFVKSAPLRPTKQPPKISSPSSSTPLSKPPLGY